MLSYDNLKKVEDVDLPSLTEEIAAQEKAYKKALTALADEWVNEAPQQAESVVVE